MAYSDIILIIQYKDNYLKHLSHLFFEHKQSHCNGARQFNTRVPGMRVAHVKNNNFSISSIGYDRILSETICER
jgi:hypothetical protein